MLDQGGFAQPDSAARAMSAAVPASGDTTATPQDGCGPGSRPEPGLQGRVPGGQVSAKGFTCNTELVARHGDSGGFKVFRYVDQSGRECAIYDTTLLFPTNAQYLGERPTGVAVLDMSNPAKPVQTATLATPAMQSPHESVVLNERRGLLAAVNGNPSFGPGIIDIYDLTKDCRQPVLQSSLPVGVLGHESGFTPDGKTFYATSLFTGNVTAVDVSNPALPVPIWQGNYRSHGLTTSEDGNRAYLADLSGLIILDTSELQARKPNPQAREVSRLTWETISVPQTAFPVTIGGRKHLVEVDEYSKNGNESLPAANGRRVGAARLIDIEDEKRPKVVSNMRLAVHAPENRAKIAGDPGADSSVQGYSAHYCAVPQPREPGIVACSFIGSGLRVFDIRDPLKPKEIAYYVAPHDLASLAPDRAPSNYAMSAPAFAPKRGEIWYSDGNYGFFSVRVTNGAWPVAGRRTAGGCLAQRSPIGPSNVGRVRLGRTREGMLRRVGPRPVSRGTLTFRWCVNGTKSGRVAAVFSSRSSRGRARLVLSTAPRHGMRAVRRGTSLRRLAARFPRARRVSRGVMRAGPESRRFFVVSRGKVRAVGVADRGLIARPAALRKFLRRAR